MNGGGRKFRWVWTQSAKRKGVSKRKVVKMASFSLFSKLGILVPVDFGTRLGVSLPAPPKNGWFSKW